MGAQQSRVRISIPQNIRCFPSFKNEGSLFETVKKIEECHLQAVQLASWIGSTIASAALVGGNRQIAFSAATILFTFLLQRMTADSSSANGDKSTPDNDKCSNNNNNTCKENDTTLEDALIDSKVSAAIAKKSVCELQAKLCVINNRYQRLLSEISTEDRRLEVVPAIQTCEEILQLFHDPTHVFRLNPLVTSPFLVAFAGIYVAISELSLVLIPSYKGPLIGEMNLLSETLRSYKEACIQIRLDALKFRSVQLGSMLDVISAGLGPELNYKMEDSCLTGSGTANQGGSSRSAPPLDDEDVVENVFHDANEAVTTYRTELEEQYTRFFATALETISKFSGFQSNFCTFSAR